MRIWMTYSIHEKNIIIQKVKHKSFSMWCDEDVVNSLSLNLQDAAIEVFLDPWIASASVCIARHPLHQKLAAFDYRYSLLHGDLVYGIDVGEQNNPDHLY